MRRFLWACVAFSAAWRMYPRECTVLPNEIVLPMIRGEAVVDGVKALREEVRAQDPEGTGWYNLGPRLDRILGERA